MAEPENTVFGAHPQDPPQLPTLAQALAVVLETCREQRKLIWMLTQNTSQETLVKLSEACYCCRGYDRPCLQNISTKGMPIYTQSFWESPRSSSTLPPITPKKLTS